MDINTTCSLNNFELTDREKIILQYIVDGYENSEISNEIFLSIHTVKAHVSAIIRKLKAKNRTHAACIAIKFGVCSLK